MAESLRFPTVFSSILIFLRTYDNHTENLRKVNWGILTLIAKYRLFAK